MRPAGPDTLLITDAHNHPDYFGHNLEETLRNMAACHIEKIRAHDLPHAELAKICTGNALKLFGERA